ncbi:MAG: response regulator [Halocynthiibacter sp.]
MNDLDLIHLLVVDDDERIRALLQKYLIKNGFWVSVARDAEHAAALLSGLDFDLIILDVMMPGEDGISFTKSIRKDRETPVLLLTARGETEDRINGLEAGADDYLAKPFEPKELLLRINAILRRVPQAEKTSNLPSFIQMGTFRYDINRAELLEGDSVIKLTANEVRLMKLFAAQLGNPITREDLARELGHDRDGSERAIDVQITRLRRKIEPNPKQPRYLQTVRGAGYMLTND